MHNVLKTIIICLVFTSVVACAIRVNAQGIKNIDKYVDGFAEGAGYEKSEAGNELINKKVGVVINAFLSILGVIFLFYMIYGGWVYMTAQGAEQKVEESLKIIRMAVIGLIIILASYAISMYVVSMISVETLTNL
jgi:hypothetical protein